MLFEYDEILKRIKKLKNNKSAGIDHIKNEFLRKSSSVHIEFYCRFFNLILETGFIPDVWCKGIILPLYKNKGLRTDPNNYRGITLLSCLGKLFTACLSDRISEFLNDKKILGFEQAGFRKEFSTIDHIFTLHCIIEFYKSKRKRVYCAFVDYRKAFDLINRSSLWMKLINTGIRGKILNVIYNMYANAKSCVKNSDEHSNFFSCGQGVRQGENLSPILFALYLNDFHEFMSNQCEGLKMLNESVHEQLNMYLRLYVLLYADDTIILAETAEELQKSLKCLHNYCEMYELQVNTSKTKIVIFSRGKVSKYPVFKFGSEEIEVVNDYIYLGVTFNYNGSFRKAMEKQIAQAKKAMFVVLQKSRHLRLPIDIILELFNVCVVPVLLYGSEIWGCENTASIDIFHRNFLRIILKSHQFTPKCMLYGESGTVDMSTLIKVRMLNFWNKLQNCNENMFSSMLCKFICKHISLNGNYTVKWFQKVSEICESIHVNVSENSQIVGINIYQSTIKSKCDAVFYSSWAQEVHDNGQCDFYRILKKQPAAENYLLTLNNPLKFDLLKFIMRNHFLPVTYNRFENENVYESVCPLCDLHVVGDETHYLFKCKYFECDRTSLIPLNLQQVYDRDPMLAIQSLVLGDDNEIKKNCQFVKKVMLHFKNTKNQRKKIKL